MARPWQVEIEGLDDFIVDLGRAIERFDDEFRDTSTDIATAIIQDAKERASGLNLTNVAGGPTRPGHLVVNSIRQDIGPEGPVLKLGGPQAPHALGAEFGAVRYRQFPVWSGSGQDSGYFFFPAIRDSREKSLEMYSEGILRMYKDAYPD